LAACKQLNVSTPEERVQLAPFQTPIDKVVDKLGEKKNNGKSQANSLWPSQ
jgi:hypothetical protein